jgi:hypothetical protein
MVGDVGFEPTVILSPASKAGRLPTTDLISDFKMAKGKGVAPLLYGFGDRPTAVILAQYGAKQGICTLSKSLEDSHAAVKHQPRVERTVGVEPTLERWQRPVLPLN